MKKRDFLKLTGAFTAGMLLSPMISCGSKEESGDGHEGENQATEFTLPELGYAFDSLAPNIDKETMEIHHGKHHAGYVRKLNAALEGSAFAGMSLEEIFAKVGEEDTAIRNNGGGHYNHSLFWSIMSPSGGGLPKGDLGDALNGTFGSFDAFKEAFSNEAKGVFGSGWAWLCMGEDKKLFITGTPNQDNPLMGNLVEKIGTPLLGIDVWEHAYYLNYQNMRGDYIVNFFNVINWEAVAERFKALA